MILEAAILQVKQGLSSEFEAAFAEAQSIISSMKGYKGHRLQKCVEESDKYLLLVNWETLEDHTLGFRQSPEYQNWKRLLHHFYELFPTVEHFTAVEKCCSDSKNR